ncbi:MAG: helix-turn-helix transcriptional regulator [Bdellovibrio sp.]|nr:helix-turn-helix transcriptional regulator [Bdellovibrio sp.]
MNKQIKFNKVLLELMEKEGITLRKLAKMTAIPLSTLGSYTSGKKSSYSPEHLVKLSDVFDVSVDYLLLGTERKSINLNNLKLEELFAGFVKLKIERVIPEDKIKSKDD